MRLPLSDDAAKAVTTWQRKRKLDTAADATRLLLRVGLSRVAGMARLAAERSGVAKFSVRKALKGVDLTDKGAVDAVLERGLLAYEEARGYERSAAVARLLLSGAARLTALESFGKREKNADGLVKKRLTEGGNKAGWQARAARRERDAERRKEEKPAKAKRAPKAAKPKKAEPEAVAAE